MVKVKYEVYTQYEDPFGECDEIVWEETNVDEYKTLEEAKREADKHPYGWDGTLVKVFIDDEYYCEYVQGEDD